MSGPAADYCPFSQTYNLCVVVEPADGWRLMYMRRLPVWQA